MTDLLEDNMAERKLFYSKNFVKTLLIIEALEKSYHEAPKTSRQILREVKNAWEKIFPDEPLKESSDKNLVTATISRHVHDMNLTGLFDIRVHEDTKLGYYNAGPLFTTAEAAVLVATLYNVSAIGADEKKNLFGKIKTATDIDGGSIVYGFERQINHKPQCKPQGNLYKVNAICKAIVEGKKIRFNLRRNRITDDDNLVVEKDSELFLTAKVDGSATHADFNLSLMSNIRILDEEFQSSKSAVRENAPPIELKITFPESLIESVFRQFKQNKMLSFAPTGEKLSGEWQFRVTISVGEDERLYQWLRQHCGKVKINAPHNVKDKLKAQLAKALSVL